MKFLVLLIAFLGGCVPLFAEESPTDVFYAELGRIEAKYRASQAKLIRQADRVVVYLVDFDGISDEDLFANDEETIAIAPYGSRTKILKTKKVKGAEQQKLLNALSKQIAKPKQMGGALCHYPIHGVRIYKGEQLLHEGTFCWMCSNFSFSYPEGAAWLDTTRELKQIFTTLMPIPQKELDRFYRKYPGAKPKKKQKSGQSAEPKKQKSGEGK